MLTQEKGEGGKKTSGENLKERCHAEFTKGEQARNRQLSPAGDGRHGAGQYHAVRRRPDLVQRREWKSGGSSPPAARAIFKKQNFWRAEWTRWRIRGP